MNNRTSLSRRDFAKSILAGSAVAVSAREGLNAGIAQKITALNQKYLDDEALDFNSRIGKTRIERRIKALSARLKQERARVPGVKVHTTADPYLSAGLTAFSMAGIEAERLVDYLREKYNLVVRTMGSREAGTYGVRVSTPIYVSTKEVDMVVEGVRTLLGHRG